MISENDSSSGNQRNTTTSTLEKSKNNTSSISQTNSSTSCNNNNNTQNIHQQQQHHPQLTNQLLHNAASTYTFNNSQHNHFTGLQWLVYSLFQTFQIFGVLNFSKIKHCLFPTSGYIPGLGITNSASQQTHHQTHSTLQNVQKFLNYEEQQSEISQMTIPKFYSSPSVAAAKRSNNNSDSHAYYLESKNSYEDKKTTRFCGKLECSKKAVYLASIEWFEIIEF